MPPRRGRRPPVARGSPRSWAAIGVHTVLSATFAWVWLWHLTEQANQQPIASKYGWFFNYITFVFLTGQAVQFPVCLIADIVGQESLVILSNDLSSALFGTATFVSAIYWGMQLTLGNLEEPKKVPLWLPLMLHSGNSVAAILDLIVGYKHRTFSWRASALIAGTIAAYCTWLPYSAYVNKQFPYPFMSKMQAPSWQYAGFAAVLLVGPQITFTFGRLVSRQLRKLLEQPNLRQD